MIKSTEELKQQRPDLVELFEPMDREQLLEQIYKEVQDGLNMEERVAVFMELCTLDMSYTTYTLESIRYMVAEKQGQDISDFCKIALEDIEGMNVEEIKNYLREEIGK